MAYQLPSFNLTIEKDNLRDLKDDLWNDEPLPALLAVDDKTYDIDIAYRGSYTRKFRKKSYRIEFVEPEFFEGVHTIHLNAEYRDPSLIRNKLSFDFFNDLGVLSPQSRHINLTRNKDYKGIYLQIESVDELFLKTRGLPPGPIYYAVNNNANFSLMRDERIKKSLLSGYQRAVGKRSDDNLLHEFIYQINTLPLQNFPDEISHYLDIDKFLRWLVGAICTMNNDGFTHNYALYFNSETHLFEIIPWDYDATWGRKVDGGIMDYKYVPFDGKKNNHLCYLLLRYPEIRKQYRTLLEETLETIFTVENMEKTITPLYNALSSHIIEDPYKKSSIDIFNNEPEFIFQFIRDRSLFLKNHLVSLG